MIHGMVHITTVMAGITQDTIAGTTMDTTMDIMAMGTGVEIIMDTTTIITTIIITTELIITTPDMMLKKAEPDITVQEEACQVYLLRKKEIPEESEGKKV